MKHFIFSACIVFITAIGCAGNEAKKKEATALNDTMTTTTSKTEEIPAAPLDSATMTKNWMAYSTPGDMHRMIKSWDGTWTGEVTSWYAPGTPPEKSKATAVNKTIMGGRYQVSNFSGSMMGTPFEGMGTLAYDNAKKVFISTWIDNMGTGLMKMEGPWDESTKSMTLTGRSVDPGSGTGREMTLREVFKVIDDKTQMMEMYGPAPDGKEYKMMEIKLTRK
jgi:hypothetical protein